MRRLLPALLLALAACEPGLSDNPDGGVTPPPPPPTAEAQSWLDAQNAVRRAPRPPPPSPLPPLTWSEAAASVAASWAAGCNYQHNPNRGERGENIAASAPPGRWQLTDAVAAWAGEASDYDYASNTCAAGKQCGHYTQIVWASTLRAGCAHKLCTANSPFGSGAPQWDFWVCDYEPPGNFVGQRPY
ncbi:MAG TPA: CAP domain-containing protein [Myxococcales bacterium]